MLMGGIGLVPGPGILFGIFFGTIVDTIEYHLEQPGELLVEELDLLKP